MAVRESTIGDTLLRVSECLVVPNEIPAEHFLFPYRTEPLTLVAIIRDWIEPGTMVISDSWAAYRNLDSEGYTHRTVNHSIQFVDPDTGAHTNTIESKWRAVKVSLGQYNRGEDYEYHLAQYMFAARCKSQNISPFLQFLHLVANTDWDMCDVPSSSARPN